MESRPINLVAVRKLQNHFKDTTYQYFRGDGKAALNVRGGRVREVRYCWKPLDCYGRLDFKLNNSPIKAQPDAIRRQRMHGNVRTYTNAGDLTIRRNTVLDEVYHACMCVSALKGATINPGRVYLGKRLLVTVNYYSAGKLRGTGEVSQCGCPLRFYSMVMRLSFLTLPLSTAAVKLVLDCYAGHRAPQSAQ